jgi:putative glycosyltransferase (TIGR04372 family)
MKATNGEDPIQDSMTAADIPFIRHTSVFAPGSHPDRPFRITAFCLDRALGDFAVSLNFAASVKELFEHASLAIYFHDDRKYKSALLKSCPQIDNIICFDGDQPLPVEGFDIAFDPPVTATYLDWYKAGCHFSDIILSPNMMGDRYLFSFEQPARLKIPVEETAGFAQRLVDAGVDPNRWFSAVHYREPNFEMRSPDPFRDTDPAVMQGVTHDIIDRLGGQVVRIGHPGMTPFTPRDGFIDLAPAGNDDFMFQLYAMSRARFMIAGASGPHDCTAALGTPTGLFAATSRFPIWNPQDAQIFSHILTPAGDRVSLDLCLQRKMHYKVILKELLSRGFSVQIASQAEIFGMATHLMGQTNDTPGWRTHWYEKPVKKTNAFHWPLPEGSHSQILFFPELAPGRREVG